MEAKDMNEMEPRIIEAAKRVFVRKGYEAATMSDVAAEVGIGRTALHYYYRTKEILFDAIFGQLLSSLLPNIDRVLDEKSTMLEKMPVIVDLYMGIVRANPMFPSFVVGELNRDPERLFQTVLRDPKKIQSAVLKTVARRAKRLGCVRFTYVPAIRYQRFCARGLAACRKGAVLF